MAYKILLPNQKLSTPVKNDVVSVVANTEEKDTGISESITPKEIVNEIESINGKGIKDQETFDFQDN